jgi:hypothetical protein
MPRSPHSPKFFVGYGAEVVWHRDSDGFPLFWDGFPKERQCRIRELFLGGVMAIMTRWVKPGLGTASCEKQLTRRQGFRENGKRFLQDRYR